MSYEKINFTSGQLLTAEHLNHMEDGIANAGPVKTVNGANPDENGNVVVEIPEVVTSWNDLTDRPFYAVEEVTEISVLSEMSVTTSTSYSKNIIDTRVSYRVYFDGVAYEPAHTSGPTGPAIGDQSLVAYPFFIYDNVIEGGCSIKVVDDGQAHTISVCKLDVSETITQLDEKYIPETIVRTSDMNNALTNSGANWNQNDSTAMDYIKNRTHYINESVSEVLLSSNSVTNSKYISGSIGVGVSYKVYFDGTAYNCVGYDAGGGFYAIGDSALTEYPFHISYGIVDAMTQARVTNDGNAHTVDIYKLETTETVVPLDDKYIPSTVQRVGGDIILKSPNGTQYVLSVSDDGILSAAAVTE